MLTDREFAEYRAEARTTWQDKPLEAVDDRRARLAARVDELAGFARRSQPQDFELEVAQAEVTFLDEICGEKRTAARRAKRRRRPPGRR